MKPAAERSNNPEKEKPEVEKEKPEVEQHTKTFTLKVINAFNLDLLQTLYPQSAPYSICENYKRNKCPHGRDGKMEIEDQPCKHLHPKKCFAWCKAGNDDKYGCKKGKDCSYYHPVLCKNSLRYRRCLTTDCTFTHLKFTKRYREKENNSTVSNQPKRPLRGEHLDPWSNQENSTSNQSTKNPPPSAATNNQSSFLEELFKSLRDTQKEMQNEMQNFKQSISQQVAQLQPQYWHQQPNHQHPQHHLQRDQSVAPNQPQHYQVNQPATQQNQPSHSEPGPQLQYPQVMPQPKWNLPQLT